MRRPWLRLSIAVPVLLVCSLCAAATLRASSSARHVEMMSAIDEYLQGKYGSGGSQALGQLNNFDHTGYAGTQSVAKEFGLSDNNPLVQQWDQSNTMDSLDDDSSLMEPEAQSAPARAAVITSSVFGEPVQAAQVAAAPGMSEDPRQAAMAAAGAKAVDSVSMAAERKQMHQQMLQKFEAQAEATTQKVAAQTAVTDTIGDGTVPSDSSYLTLPGAPAASASAVPALAAAAKAVVKKPAATSPATTAAVKPGAAAPALPKAAATTAAPKSTTAKGKAVKATAATATVAAKKAGSAVDKEQKQSKPAPKVSYKLHLEEEVKKLEKEVRAKNGHTQHTENAVPAQAQARSQSWSGLANMLDSQTPEEV